MISEIPIEVVSEDVLEYEENKPNK